MPITYKLDRASRIMHSAYQGSISDDDIRVHLDNLAHDPGFDPGFHHLADASAAIRIHVSADMIRFLAQKEMFLPTIKRAIVVSSDEAYGLARMFHSLRSRAQELTRVFYGVVEAKAWLEEKD